MYSRTAIKRSELMITVMLALATLIPRLLLANQLDMVTDEIVYIHAGQIYQPLLQQLQFWSTSWQYNYEHPPVAKLLIGFSITINTALGHPLSDLFAGRLPSVLSSMLMVVAIYWLGKAPFGRVVALGSTLCLAFSPWLVYFGALAYLDMTMTTCVTVAFLLLWHAIRWPWLYPLCGLCIAVGVASKYTAVLIIPGMVLFVAYYFLALRRHLPQAEQPAIPWWWWLTTIILTPTIFVAMDPAIWPDPYNNLLHSFAFEWEHSIHGHLTFIAGRYSLHVPHWAIFYILGNKISAFVTLAALGFVVYALIQQIYFYSRQERVSFAQATSNAYLLIWLLSLLGTFSLLNIVVGTHYHLPLAAPVVLAGGTGLAALLRYRRGDLLQVIDGSEGRVPCQRFNWYGVAMAALIVMTLVLPHLLGLLTVRAEEGYTSELFQGENGSLQVAYPAYREAVRWLADHHSGSTRIGLVAIKGTLTNGNGQGLTWFRANADLPRRLSLHEVQPGSTSFNQDYLVWPMHLEQRGFLPPEPWRSHVIHTVMGGQTIYCYILAWDTGTLSH